MSGFNNYLDENNLRKNTEQFLTFLKTYDIIELLINNKLVLAGGALNRMLDYSPKSDFDFYFKDKQYMDKFFYDIEVYNQSHNHKFKLEYKSNNAYTFNFNDYEFQFIILPHMIFSNPKDLIGLFDFSICQIAYDFEFDDFIYSDLFFKDFINRKIHFNINSRCPISSLIRLDKYKNRHFTIDNSEIMKIIFSIQNLNFKTYSDVSFALTGISTVSYEGFVKLLLSDEYKNKSYNIMEFIKLFDDYIIAQQILEELSESENLMRKI